MRMGPSSPSKEHCTQHVRHCLCCFVTEPHVQLGLLIMQKQRKKSDDAAWLEVVKINACFQTALEQPVSTRRGQTRNGKSLHQFCLLLQGKTMKLNFHLCCDLLLNGAATLLRLISFSQIIIELKILLVVGARSIIQSMTDSQCVHWSGIQRKKQSRRDSNSITDFLNSLFFRW